MAYDSSDLSASVNKVRLLIGDRDTSYQLFTDAEINQFLSQEPDLRMAAALALDALAAEADRAAVRFSLLGGDASIDRTQIAANYRASAAALRKDAAAEPGHHLQEIGQSVDPATGLDETDYDSANSDLDPYVTGLDYWDEGGG